MGISIQTLISLTETYNNRIESNNLMNQLSITRIKQRLLRYVDLDFDLKTSELKHILSC